MNDKTAKRQRIADETTHALRFQTKNTQRHAT